MELIFATNNRHKLDEVRVLAGEKYKILGLREAGIVTDIPEEQDTIAGNASQKSHFIYELSAKNCFADDTGLEVNALGGEPGVFSARYSRIGEPVFPEMDVVEGNIHKLLLKLRSHQDRSARFKTVISLIAGGEEFLFEGTVEGTIINQPRGAKGFGYDPVFLPEGYDKTFAEMDLAEKNLISHRARAVRKLMDFLHKVS